MAVDKDKMIRVKVTMPRDLHGRLQALADARGTPLSQLLLQAAIEKYPDAVKPLDNPTSPG